MCILEETLTPAERNLLKLGEHQRLRDTRIYFQYASVREFCEPVEQITGRTIRSFHSSIDTEADGLVVETSSSTPRARKDPRKLSGPTPRSAVRNGGRVQPPRRAAHRAHARRRSTATCDAAAGQSVELFVFRTASDDALARTVA